MKFFIAALSILAVVAFTSAFVVVPNRMDHEQDARIVRLEDVDTDAGLKISPTTTKIRNRRFTCDLFSFSSSVVTPNHAACAFKCMGMGRGGGHCEGTTCVCRTDKWVPW